MNENIRWSVPREWEGERCFILCGGESLNAVRQHLPALKGRIIAIKQTALLRPDADVMFLAGRDDRGVCREIFPAFRGTYTVCRSYYVGFPPHVLMLRRMKDPFRLSDLPTHLAGLDAGASAINLAYLFGAREIVLLGYDQRGGRWLNGELPHHLPYPPQFHFTRHIKALIPLARDLKARGVRVVNCSVKSAVTAFEKRPLEEFL